MTFNDIIIELADDYNLYHHITQSGLLLVMPYDKTSSGNIIFEKPGQFCGDYVAIIHGSGKYCQIIIENTKKHEYLNLNDPSSIDHIKIWFHNLANGLPSHHHPVSNMGTACTSEN